MMAGLEASPLFSEKLNAAFEDLAENNEPMPEGRKVRKLITSITNPTLAPAITQVVATPNLNSNYESACHSLLRQWNNNQC